MEILGKQFELLISQKNIEPVIVETSAICSSYPNNTVFVVMANGGNWFSQQIFSHFPTKSLHIEYAQLKSYSADSQGEISVVSLPKVDNLTDKHVIILEDIIDSGETMKFMIDWCQHVAHVKSVDICCLCLRDGVKASEYAIANRPLVVEKGKWIVGCGLDFDHHGRNLPEIYAMCK